MSTRLIACWDKNVPQILNQTKARIAITRIWRVSHEFDVVFKREKNTAKQAKERLQILIAHERVRREGPDFLPQLQQ